MPFSRNTARCHHHHHLHYSPILRCLYCRCLRTSRDRAKKLAYICANICDTSANCPNPIKNVWNQDNGLSVFKYHLHCRCGFLSSALICFCSCVTRTPFRRDVRRVACAHVKCSSRTTRCSTSYVHMPLENAAREGCACCASHMLPRGQCAYEETLCIQCMRLA